MTHPLFEQYEIAPGTKKQVTIFPDVAEYPMPATLIRGRQAGRTILITASIHSGEYPGIPATIRLAKQIDPAEICGEILIIHCVNIGGFWAKSDSKIPEDGFNLNGDYPGKPSGSVGERIAHYFVTSIFPHVDFIIDLHSGGQNEPLQSCLFFPAGAGEQVRAMAEAAARATTIPHLLASFATSGQYSYAANQLGIPGLLLERGHSGHCEQAWVDGYVSDLYNLLAHLDVWPTAPITQPPTQTVWEKTVYLTSDHQGLWYPQVYLGQRVKKGDILGRIENFWGDVLQVYAAEADGEVMYYTAGLAVHPGNALVAYSLMNQAHA